MKCNKWTLALIGAGLVSVPAVMHADESTNSVMSALSATTISGYVDTSAEWNFGTGNANLPPYAFGGPSKADGFNLDVVKLTIAKDVVPSDVWGAGYKVDMLMGPDANTFNTASFFGGTKAANGDFAVKQAYVALHAPVGNGLDFKLGVWDTIIGYEVFEAGNNPNFTRSYGYTMEPTTHTGLLGTYQLCDAVSMSFGVADTFGPSINERAQGPNLGTTTKAESYKTYMGAVTFTAPTNMSFLAGSTLTACVINGYNSAVAGPNGSVGANETSYYVGATINTPLSWLKVGLAFDDLDVGPLSGENWCVGAYVSAQATEKLSFYARGEYLKNRGDQKLFVNGAGAPTAPDEVMELTLTAQYDLWKNVMSRLELRWDHSLTDQGVWGGTSANGSNEGVNEGHLDNSVMLALNIIYKF